MYGRRSQNGQKDPNLHVPALLSSTAIRLHSSSARPNTLDVGNALKSTKNLEAKDFAHVVEAVRIYVSSLIFVKL